MTYILYIFFAGLAELEKENKFHYGVATRLLPVHTQPPPPCRGSPALSVGAWGAECARQLQYEAYAYALKHEPLSENAPFFFLEVSIWKAGCARGAHIEVTPV